ncbi:MAG: NADH-quinone oxidoreductase subunit N [Spirochaetes bacterium]|nr:NADH-quinone oxidoreductase subunit N [Spirochaetota bacterium]
MELFISLLPFIVLIAVGIIILFIDVAPRQGRNVIQYVLALTAIAAAGVLFFGFFGRAITVLSGVLIYDSLSLLLAMTVLAAAFVLVMLSRPYLEAKRAYRGGEFYFFVLTALVGVFGMLFAGNLLVIIVSLEVLSVALYFLAAMDQNDPAGIEGAVKYFILGAVALAFTLYGTALVYGFTHALDIDRIAAYTIAAESYPVYFYIGLIFLFIGFAFKLALVPFHFWAPDAYEGANTLATGIMSVLPKIGAFAVMFKIVQVFFTTSHVQSTGAVLMWFIAVIAVLSMTAGNFFALTQTSLKRLFAYSSIVHSGFILSALVAYNGMQAAAFYLIVYAAMTVGVFAVLVYLSGTNDANLTLQDLNGAAKRHPLVSGLFVFLLASFAGIPPFAGFFAKFYVFKVLIDGGHLWLAIVGIINALLAVYYYLKLILAMYTREGAVETKRAALSERLAIGIAAVAVLALGIFPSIILKVM